MLKVLWSGPPNKTVAVINFWRSRVTKAKHAYMELLSTPHHHRRSAVVGRQNPYCPFHHFKAMAPRKGTIFFLNSQTRTKESGKVILWMRKNSVDKYHGTSPCKLCRVLGSSRCLGTSKHVENISWPRHLHMRVFTCLLLISGKK